MTQVALDTVKDVLINRLEPINCAAKLADIWSIRKRFGVY